MRKFISGLIAGIIITLSIGVLADNQLLIESNPFPVLVNGVREIVDAYNINGYTYIKLSDIPKATNNAVTVKFNNVKEEINITTVESNLTASPEQKASSDIQTYIKGGIEVTLYNGVEYVQPIHIKETSPHHSYIMWNPGSSPVTYSLYYDENGERDKKPLILDVPILWIHALPYVTYEYYVNTILPLIK